MNRFDPPKKPSEAIRSDINETRQKMDSTIDALADRLKGKHLLDELLGLFRSNGNGHALKDKLSESTSSAVHAVVGAVKAHPLPLLVVGAGLAWLIYERQEQKHPKLPRYSPDREPDDTAYPASAPWPGIENPVTEPASAFPPTEDEASGHVSGAKEKVREKTRHLKERIQHKASEMKTQAQEGLHHLRERASEAGSHLRERTHEIAERTRSGVARTTREHPLETGLTCLALGLIAGLLTPTSGAVRDAIAPTSRRLRDRVQSAGEDLAERGKRVMHAATDAARDEAESQGLTPEAMKERMREGSNPPGSGPVVADQPDSPDTPLEYPAPLSDAPSGNRPPSAPM